MNKMYSQEMHKMYSQEVGSASGTWEVLSATGASIRCIEECKC
jgi:hypothetical protein